MSTQKTNQPGDAAAKHLSFTPAHHEAGDSTLPTGQAAGDNARNQQPQAGQSSAGSTGQQQENQSTSNQSGNEDGLEAKAKTWLNQQQWLQNVDVNQLSKQAKDLGNKAVEQVNRLTPTQKVVGGALIVSGLSWLALRSKSSKSSGNYGSSAADSHEDNDTDTWQRSSESVYRGRKTHS